MHRESTVAARYIEPQSPLSVRRTLTDFSQARGQLVVTLKNHAKVALLTSYLETMPWIVQFYVHTLSVKLNGAFCLYYICFRSLTHCSSQPVGNPAQSLLSNLTYIPAHPHSSPTTLQFQLLVPAESTLKITMDVTKAFLRYTEHPPDAQRGWDLPGAVVEYQFADSEDHNDEGRVDKKRMYTPPLLIDPATPDFSMPYNVIIFTCSLVAFLFGSVFNILTRRVVIVRVGEAGEKGAKEGQDTVGQKIVDGNGEDRTK